MLRTKTREKLTVEQQIKVENFLKNILHFDPQTIETFAWKFTYCPEKAKSYGLDINSEAALSLRSDILVQYRKQNPNWDFAKKYTQDEYSETTECLRKAVRGDEIAIHVVMDKIQVFVRQYADNTINRAVYLLESEFENYKFGGLKTLGFNEEETRFLLEYANAIGYTVAKVSESKIREEEKLFFEDGKEVLEERKEEPQDACDEEVIEEEIPEKTEESSKEKHPVSQKIAYLMENEDAIRHIFEASDLLKKAEEEHDIEWLSKNRETIEKFYDALKNLQ